MEDSTSSEWMFKQDREVAKLDALLVVEEKKLADLNTEGKEADDFARFTNGKTPEQVAKAYDEATREMVGYANESGELERESGIPALTESLFRDYDAENPGDPGMAREADRIADGTDPVALDVPGVAAHFRQKLQEARQAELAEDITAVSDPANSFENLGKVHIKQVEGRFKKLTPDADGLSIGYGYNTKDAEVMQVLKDAGHTLESLKEKGMSETEADEVLPAMWKLKQKQAVKALGGKEIWSRLGDKQRTAMTSLAYNALTLLGKGLKSAVRDFVKYKDIGTPEADEKVDTALALMNYEIRWNSLPHAKMIAKGEAKYIDGLNVRRNKEADMAMGAFLNDADDKARYAVRSNDNWRKKFAADLKKYRSINKKKGFKG